MHVQLLYVLEELFVARDFMYTQTCMRYKEERGSVHVAIRLHLDAIFLARDFIYTQTCARYNVDEV